MKAKCNTCEYVFTPEPQERDLSDEVKEIFFVCPRCGKEYRISVTDKLIRRMATRRRMIVRLIEIERLRKNGVKIKKLQDENDRIKAVQIRHEKMLDLAWPEGKG